MNDLAPHGHGVIRRIHGNSAVLNRLLALGFTPGAQVTHLFSAPFGDPVVFRVRGYTLAIGREQARLVELTQEAAKKRKESVAFLPL